MKARNSTHTHKNTRYGNYQRERERGCVATILTIFKERKDKLENFGRILEIIKSDTADLNKNEVNFRT